MKYLSCEWIESRIVLEMEALKFCCIGHSGHKGYVPMFPYKGGPLDIERIKAARAELTRQNNDPKVDTGCKGCHFLVMKDWEKERKSAALFDRVYVSNFSICNLACRYCFVYLREFSEVSNVAGYPLVPIFDEMIQKGYLAEDAYVEWGGGEPTIVKDFEQIMRTLMAKGYTQQVHTSSVRFSKATAEGLASGSVRAVTSVDSGTRATYLEVKGRDRFDAVWESIGKYYATGGNMTVKYILRRNNSNDANIEGFFEKARQAGVKRLVLTPDFQEMGKGAVTEETIAAFARMKHQAELDGIHVEIRDELVSPQQMRILSRYMPWSEKEPLYRKYQQEEALREAQRKADWEAYLVQNAAATQVLVERAERLASDLPVAEHPFQLLDRQDQQAGELYQLLERQVQCPDQRLSGALARVVASRSMPHQQRLDGAVALGISPDGWTVGGQAGYVVLDASGENQPLERDMWFSVWAPPAEYPVRLKISTGIPGEVVDYTYLEPQILRVQMPVVPAGETRVFKVETDKTWMPEGGQDTRQLGVRISTHY
jgi:molybdenum cofactor biosynthesis enzyme MoaA